MEERFTVASRPQLTSGWPWWGRWSPAGWQPSHPSLRPGALEGTLRGGGGGEKARIRLLNAWDPLLRQPLAKGAHVGLLAEVGSLVGGSRYGAHQWLSRTTNGCRPPQPLPGNGVGGRGEMARSNNNVLRTAPGRHSMKVWKLSFYCLWSTSLG